MKAQRKQLYDEDDLDIDGYSDSDPFDDENDIDIFKPRRSVTLNDFFAPGLLSQDEGEAEDEDEDYDDNDNFWGVKTNYEEDYDEYSPEDEEMLNNCFAELDKKYDYSKCNKEQMIDSLRELNYDMKQFIDYALDGDFGVFLPKKKRSKPQKSKSRTPQNKRKITPSFPRSVSQFTLAKPPKQHVICKRTPESVIASLSCSKKRINLVIVGHVDAGKSTLMGHLLWLCGKVTHGQMTKVTNASEELGKGEDRFAWIMAEDDEERKRGITIDVAMTELETNQLIVTILDAPGHKDFVPNMIAGASQADSALLVVDASNPNIETGQAKEHLLLCRSLGVNSLIIAINKMDYVGYDESTYEAVKTRLTTFLRTLGWSAIQFIPTDSKDGDNLKKNSKNMKWYNGPTIYEAIDMLQPPQYDINSPFLLCISEVNEGKRLKVVGRIESGFICKGDTIRALPIDSFIKVDRVKVNGKQVQFAAAGTIAEITLQTQLTSNVITIGSALTAPEKTIPVAAQFIARINTFKMDVPLLKGASLVFHRHAVDIPLKILRIKSLLNKKTKEIVKNNPPCVPQNTMADVEFKLDEPIPMELQVNSKSFGRFIIRAGGVTLGFGGISEIIQHK
ncbi:HBS1-like protein isoform X6 [Histomonas meleagridis]|uniref:HBS1-like protein isoform X6 n=1 Tax=Histomonas meleagridis TaxID=135588 RepID=UPI0035595942|nr:HBS1-like protein isoform X6 [Histomonas meleagridis]KAH0806281.1 HBS1-like protein isoform X6 [Histomonas meleagridis]